MYFKKGRKYLIISSLFSFICVLISCLVAIIFIFIFEIRINYLIQENPVFPYLGEIVRLTGPFKPTAKLFVYIFNFNDTNNFVLAFNVKNKKIKILLFTCSILGIFNLSIYSF